MTGLLGRDYTTKCNKMNIFNLMVVDALDINMPTSFVDNAIIFTSNASISSFDDKRFWVLRCLEAMYSI